MRAVLFIFINQSLVVRILQTNCWTCLPWRFVGGLLLKLGHILTFFWSDVWVVVWLISLFLSLEIYHTVWELGLMINAMMMMMIIKIVTVKIYKKLFTVWNLSSMSSISQLYIEMCSIYFSTVTQNDSSLIFLVFRNCYATLRSPSASWTTATRWGCRCAARTAWRCAASSVSMSGFSSSRTNRWESRCGAQVC